MAGSDELIAREDKLKALKRAGVRPYGGRFAQSHSIEQLRHSFESLASSEEEISIAGRIMSLRGHGKASFADLEDQTGRIQIYAKLDTVGEKAYRIFRLVDIGDFIGVSGVLFKTRTGELSVLIKGLSILSKSLRPLPEKRHGLKDTELRYRKRYLDLIMNRESRNIFETRTRVISIIRKFLEKRGYMEVETPMLQPRAGGASGEPFKTRASALDMDLYLRIAPELYLKRLLVGGLERVYEINRSFRNEGISRRHSPEFTMLEVYAAYADYTDMMQLTEELISEISNSIFGKTKLNYEGEEIDLTPPWKRVSFSEAMREKFGIDVEKEGVETLKHKLKDEGVQLKDKSLTRNQLIRILSELLTSKSPTFIVDYPVEFCPLAKRKPESGELAERFELFVCGCELANAYSELNDPKEQRERFLKQIENREEESVDEDFVTALEYGMPPAAGLGIGIDRLVMAMTNSYSIRDVILFPQLKRVEGSK